MSVQTKVAFGRRALTIISSLLFVSSLYGADSDMDGVSDARDKCPNTPFTDLVDINGCTKTSLAQNHHYDIIVGLTSFLSF